MICRHKYAFLALSALSVDRNRNPLLGLSWGGCPLRWAPRVTVVCETPSLSVVWQCRHSQRCDSVALECHVLFRQLAGSSRDKAKISFQVAEDLHGDVKFWSINERL